MSVVRTKKVLNRQLVTRPGLFSKMVVNLTASLFCILFLMPVFSFSQIKVGVKNDMFSVVFPTEQDGWASGRWGTMLNTKDGGQTWGSQKTGVDYTLNSVHFVDTENGWAVGDEGTIVHTSNGGKTWEVQKSPVKTFLMGVHFVDTKTGWIVTEKTTILYTSDSGKNWTIQFQAGDYILKDISFCDSLNGWVVGEFGFTYNTKDGGKTWVHQAGFFGFSQKTFDMVGGNFLFDVVAVDPMTAWAVGIDGYVTKTSDGGKTWQHVINNNIPKAHLFGVVATNEGKVFFAGNGCLIASYDNGENFSSPIIKPHIKYGWLYGITKRGTKGFVAVGKQSWIFLSDNDGRSLEKIDVETGN